MLSKTDSMKIVFAAISLVEIIILILLKFVFKIDVSFLAFVFLLLAILEIAYLFFFFETEKRTRDIDIARFLGKDAKEALDYGEVGMIIYDSNYMVTWVSEFLESRGFNIIGEKLTKAIEGLASLFKENTGKITMEADGHIYEFIRGEVDPVVFVKDITEYFQLNDTYNRERLVLGLVHFDNYNETVQHEDEQMIAAINTNIRQKVVNWVSEYHGVIRRIRAERFLVIINQADFRNMLNSKFDILNEVKKAAASLNVEISTSMSFASGYSSIEEQDSAINDLMELVLSRGGDQVAVRSYGEEVQFFGATSQASAQTSKVRARVMAKGFAGVVDESDKIFIVPHSDADLDALGACLGFDYICSNHGKSSYIIFNGIKVEPKALEIYDNNVMDLVTRHVFISEAEALDMLDENSLVVVCDHHSNDLSSAPKLVEASKRTVIIDHHRRKNDNNISAMLIYNEPAASSTVELISEMLQYQAINTDLDDLDATIMYCGLLVDTDFLKARCTARSFEACAYLKRQGADSTLANEWLKDSLEDFVNRISISKYMEVVNNEIAIAAVDAEDRIFSRTTLAQCANYLNTIKGIEASFVIGRIDDSLIAVSGRSNGKINVQVILEKMGGGGHYNAAGLQRSSGSVKEIRQELLKAIEEYQQGGNSNESDSAD